MRYFIPRILSQVLSSSLPRTLAVAAFIAAVAACTNTNNNPAQAPEAQSHAEHELAKESYKTGRLRDVLAHVKKALEHDEGNADAAYLGASVYLQFCAADPSSPDCHWEDAEKYARMAIEANPEMRDAKNMLGVILIHRQQYDEAITVLKPLANDILYNFPENAWGNLGWAYLERGNYDDAIDALRRAIAAQPLFCLGSYNLGLAYEKKGDKVAARDAFTKAVETPAPECQRLQVAFDARSRVSTNRDEIRADLTKCVDLERTNPVGKSCSERLKSLQ